MIQIDKKMILNILKVYNYIVIKFAFAYFYSYKIYILCFINSLSSYF